MQTPGCHILHKKTLQDLFKRASCLYLLHAIQYIGLGVPADDIEDNSELSSLEHKCIMVRITKSTI